jgi:hypothetical protein
MSPPPPPPPLGLPSFTRKGKKHGKQPDVHFDEKSVSSHPSGLHSRSSSGSHGSQSSLLAFQSPSQARSPLARFASYSPTATLTDASDPSKAEIITSRAEMPTVPEDTESAPEPTNRSRKKKKKKFTRRGIFRCNFGFRWGLCFGRKDKDEDGLSTEIGHSSSATTILPIHPRGEDPSFFVPDEAHIPTHHISQRSKTSYPLKRGKDSQASSVTKSSNLSGWSKGSNDSRSDSANTLAASALERMETYQDIREYKDTTTQLAELRQLMAENNLDY